MNSSITNRPPDETEKAGARIAAAIIDTNAHVDHATARLIAATLHTGSGTALERFAATGRFDVIELTRETRLHRFPERQEIWRDALLNYLESALARQPWRRDSAKRQEERMRDQRNRLFPEGERTPPFHAEKPSNSASDQVK